MAKEPIKLGKRSREQFYDWTETGVLDKSKYTSYRLIIDIKSPIELAFTREKVYHMAKRTSQYVNWWLRASGNQTGAFITKAVFAKAEEE